MLEREESAEPAGERLRLRGENLAQGGNLCVLFGGCHCVALSCLDFCCDADLHSVLKMDDPISCPNFFGAGMQVGGQHLI
jgi:hypothetical protein